MYLECGAACLLLPKHWWNMVVMSAAHAFNDEFSMNLSYRMGKFLINQSGLRGTQFPGEEVHEVTSRPERSNTSSYTDLNELMRGLP